MLNKTIDFPVYLQRIPSPQFKNTGTLVFLKQVPLIWTLMMLMTILHTVKNIVSEKEAGIKTYMMVMGLDSVAFYSSHFLIGLFKMAIVVIICSVAFSFGLQVETQ